MVDIYIIWCGLLYCKVRGCLTLCVLRQCYAKKTNTISFKPLVKEISSVFWPLHATSALWGTGDWMPQIQLHIFVITGTRKTLHNIRASVTRVNAIQRDARPLSNNLSCGNSPQKRNTLHFVILNLRINTSIFWLSYGQTVPRQLIVFYS